MILWTIKLFKEVRKAIAGRKFPAQLAWAVAFGILLGIIPHGNLLAIGVLLVVLSLKLNHAMAGLTAVATSFLATWLDPVSHQLGDYVLTHPQVSELATTAWQWPLVPWTDLNNTVVMGSFLIGATAVLPTFFVAYPIFRALAPRNDVHPSSPDPTPPKGGVARSGRQSATNRDHRPIAGSPSSLPPASTPLAIPGAGDSTDDPSETNAALGQQSEEAPIAVETRIDVIRMKDYRSAELDDRESSSATESIEADDSDAMDEGLRYLLHQLRDSQQRKAA